MSHNPRNIHDYLDFTLLKYIFLDTDKGLPLKDLDFVIIVLREIVMNRIL